MTNITGWWRKIGVLLLLLGGASCGALGPMVPTQKVSLHYSNPSPYIEGGLYLQSILLPNGDLVTIRQWQDDTVIAVRYGRDTLQVLWEHKHVIPDLYIESARSYYSASDNSLVFFGSLAEQAPKVGSCVFKLNASDGSLIGDVHRYVQAVQPADLALTDTATPEFSPDSSLLLQFWYSYGRDNSPPAKDLEYSKQYAPHLKLQFLMLDAERGSQIRDSVLIPLGDTLSDAEEAIAFVHRVMLDNDGSIYILYSSPDPGVGVMRYNVLQRASQVLQLRDPQIDRYGDIDLVNVGAWIEGPKQLMITGMLDERRPAKAAMLLAQLDFEKLQVVFDQRHKFTSDAMSEIDLPFSPLSFAPKKLIRYPGKIIIVGEQGGEGPHLQTVTGQSIGRSSGDETSTWLTYKASTYFSGSLHIMAFSDDGRFLYHQGARKHQEGKTRNSYRFNAERSFQIRKEEDSLRFFYRWLAGEQEYLASRAIEVATGNIGQEERLIYMPYGIAFLHDHLHWLDRRNANMIVWERAESELARVYRVRLK